MSERSPSTRVIARRLLAAVRPAGTPRPRDAVVVCERLHAALSRFAGTDGSSALLGRALTLAREDVPALKSVRLGPSGELQGLEEIVSGEGGAEAAIAVAAHVLELLVTLIGEPLTVRLVRDGWPGLNVGPDDTSDD